MIDKELNNSNNKRKKERRKKEKEGDATGILPEILVILSNITQIK